MTVPKPLPSARAVPAPVTHELAAQAEPPAEIDASRGYRFLTVSTSPDTAARLSGENVSSMFIMTEPIEGEAFAPAKAKPAATTGAAQSGASAAHPAPKPKAKPKPIATAAAKPAPKTEAPAKPAEQAAPPPPDADAVQADAESTEALPAETAEAAFVEPVPLTRQTATAVAEATAGGEICPGCGKAPASSELGLLNPRGQRFASARSSFFDSLPTMVLGSSSRNSISAGSSSLESFPLRNWSSSVAVAALPSFSFTKAFGASPR